MSDAILMQRRRDFRPVKAQRTAEEAATEARTLAKTGMATMPDRKEPNSAVAAQCAARLTGQ